MTISSNRQQFRESVFSRDSHTCTVPWCENEADDAHHIIERAVWSGGGYIARNGASVCNKHHRYAEGEFIADWTNSDYDERGYIPPQAFWLWTSLNESYKPLPEWDSLPEITPEYLPDGFTTTDLNKWGTELDSPPHQNKRERIKYPSSRHLLPLYWYDSSTVASERTERDDTGLESIEPFVGCPLVITRKMDGSNCMITNDVDNPVRGRNGSRPLDTMRPFHRDGGTYWQQQVHQKLPDRLQVFGEYLRVKHSIHYGCDCESECEDVGPALSELTGIDDERAYFHVFGVFDKRLNMWLSWPTTEQVADKLGFPTAPVLYCEDSADNPTFETPHEARDKLIQYAREVISEGGEGIVIRSKYPYHYGQFSYRLGKYVRENHVKTDEHWQHAEKVQNRV